MNDRTRYRNGQLRTIGLAGGIFLAAAATAVMAHTGATGVVKDRMTGMKDMGESVKTISAMMRGEAPLDPDRIREEAEKIKDHAGETLTSLFPEGSTGAPSEAKETIWKRWEEFTALANDLENAAGGLATRPWPSRVAA